MTLSKLQITVGEKYYPHYLKNPAQVMFSSMWEIENLLFVYRLVCNGIFGMVPETVEDVLH